ncbi:MAG: hypothetical protein GX931_01540 [Acholeplasmataceae bacterium]|nr:hypothetical protein [Acholeplasmataceae bacterium]
MSNSTKKHLLVLELYCLRTISLDIVRKKYRELARIFHPDISRKNTSPQMVLINNAKDFIIDNLGEANHVLSLIWQNRNFEFGAVYDEANKPYSSKTPLEELMVKASMFRAIDGFKDATRKAKEVEDLINKIIEEERRGEKLYESTLLDINSATIEELQKAIKVLESIITYRDARQLIVKYKAAITQKLKEIERIKAIYKNAQAQINASMTVAEIEKIIKELNSIATYQDAAKLIIVYYDRLNQIGSVDLKLANERKEIRYRELTPLLKRAKTKDAYQNIVKEFSKLGGYKDSTFIIENAKEQIRLINEKELYDKNQRIYNGAKKHLSYEDNKSLQMAIDELRKVINFKDAKDLIAEARRRIIENDDLSRKTELYNKNLKLIKSDKLAVLEKARNVYSSLGDFKDSKQISNKLEAKITEIQKKIYQNAVIKNIDKTENIEPIKKSIMLLKTITSYKDAETLIKKYQERITSIAKQKALDEKKRIENAYQEGLIKADDDITVDFLNEKIAILKTIEDYKDSKTLISKYRDHIRHIKAKKAAAHWKRFKFVYIASALVVFLVAGLSTNYGIKLKNNNNHVVNLLENGDIEAARDFIQNNDIPQKEKVEKVILSADYLEVHNYDDAISTFVEIDGVVNVEYDTAGGNPTSNPTVFKKSYISKPSKDGYEPGEWLVKSYHFHLKNEYKLNIELMGKYTNIITYTITYNYDGGDIVNNPKTYTVNTPTFNLLSTTKIGHTFVGWFSTQNYSGAPVTSVEKGSIGNITLYAKFNINSYTISFDSNGGTAIESITKAFNEEVREPQTPTRAGHSFIGWFEDLNDTSPYVFNKMPAHNLVLYARWKILSYTITWLNSDGELLKAEELQYGSTPYYGPENPEYPETEQYYYVFTGWEPAISKVVDDQVYTAEYEQNIKTYEITWLNKDGSLLKKEELPYGSTPYYGPKDPEYPQTDQYNYTFTGWDPEIVEVTGNKVYTAQYVENINTYTITWQNYDGEELHVDKNVPYGTMPFYEGKTPVKSLYEFIGWSPKVEVATKDVTYKAVFSENHILMGQYPQSLVTNIEMIEFLNLDYGITPDSDNSNGWTSYKNYIEGSNENDFMWYKDVEIGEIKYRGVYFTSYLPNETLMQSTINTSTQPKNGYYINEIYWFKFESVSWDIRGDYEGYPQVPPSKLLLSTFILDSRYYTRSKVGTDGVNHGHYYHNSDIVKWLHIDMSNLIFNEQEKELIMGSHADSGPYNLVLPSTDELTNSNYGYTDDTEATVTRVKMGTDYAKAMGLAVSADTGTPTWLTRTPTPLINLGYLVNMVTIDGAITSVNIYSTWSGISPSMRLSSDLF